MGDQRQGLLLHPLPHVIGADGLLGSGDQVLVVAVAAHLVQLLVELLQLRHSYKQEIITSKYYIQYIIFRCQLCKGRDTIRSTGK